MTFDFADSVEMDTEDETQSESDDSGKAVSVEDIGVGDTATVVTEDGDEYPIEVTNFDFSRRNVQHDTGSGVLIPDHGPPDIEGPWFVDRSEGSNATKVRVTEVRQ